MKTKLLIIACMIIWFPATHAFSEVAGDTDGSGTVELQDVIIAIQVCAGMSPPDAKPDANNEAKIGLAEAVLAFQIVSGIFILPYNPGDLGIPIDHEENLIKFSEGDDGGLLVAGLPDRFDWRSRGVVTRAKNELSVTPADHQGRCGCCWAFVATGAMESKILMAGGPEYDLSEQQQVSCNTQNQYGCCGGYLNGALFWQDKGPVEESCTQYDDYGIRSCNCPRHCSKVSCGTLETCPQLPYRTDTYYAVSTADSNDMKISLMQDGPAPLRFLVYRDFFDFWNTGEPGAVYKQSDDTLLGGHAAILIGWDDTKKAWLFKNSWGERGPDSDGTFWMAYSGHANDLKLGMSNFTIKTADSVP
jgi:hypothetical protein